LNNSNIKTLFKKAIGIFLMAFFTFLNSSNLSAQSNFKRFIKLTCPEKRWVIFHPFIAKNVYIISLESSKKAQELKADSTLDGDLNGGQLDAFRHSYWMARTTQTFGWRRAHSLGNAHEKGNYKDFKKHRLEEGSLPDEQSCEMDYLNNDVGIQIGKDNLSANSEELTIKIKELINSGKLFIIKKNKKGDFLNCNNTVISNDEITGKWQTQTCIVSSNTLN
jgi:hypothetical protein